MFFLGLESTDLTGSLAQWTLWWLIAFSRLTGKMLNSEDFLKINHNHWMVIIITVVPGNWYDSYIALENFQILGGENQTFQ